MKALCIALAANLALALNGQTNGPAAEPAAATNAPPRVRPPTEIFSDSSEFNLKSRSAIYIGHVRVLDSQMKLNCEILTASVPPSGSKIDSIIAEHSVVIDAADEQGHPIHATSDRAVYTYKIEGGVTNEMITLTGNPQVRSQFVSGTGDKIVWNRASNSIRVDNQHMIIQQDVQSSVTNAAGPARKPEPK